MVARGTLRELRKLLQPKAKHNGYRNPLN